MGNSKGCSEVFRLRRWSIVILDLRYTFGTEMYRRTGDPLVVEHLMCHRQAPASIKFKYEKRRCRPVPAASVMSATISLQSVQLVMALRLTFASR